MGIMVPPHGGGGRKASHEGRGGGFQQVNVGGKTPHRDKRKKLAAEQGESTALYWIV